MTTTSTDTLSNKVKLKGFANKETFGPTYTNYIDKGFFETHGVELSNDLILVVDVYEHSGIMRATVYDKGTTKGRIVANKRKVAGETVAQFMLDVIAEQSV